MYIYIFLKILRSGQGNVSTVSNAARGRISNKVLGKNRQKMCDNDDSLDIERAAEAVLSMLVPEKSKN